MSDYSKDELITLSQENPQEFNEWIKDKEPIFDLHNLCVISNTQIRKKKSLVLNDHLNFLGGV